MGGSSGGRQLEVPADERREQRRGLRSLALAGSRRQPTVARAEEGDRVHRGHRVVEGGRVEHPPAVNEARLPRRYEGDLPSATR
jgi:hypothetical protein